MMRAFFDAIVDGEMLRTGRIDDFVVIDAVGAPREDRVAEVGRALRRSVAVLDPRGWDPGRDRIVVVGTRDGRMALLDTLTAWPGVQRVDLPTGGAPLLTVLVPLLRILQRSPDGVVTFLPADLQVDEDALVDGIRHAVWEVRGHPAAVFQIGGRCLVARARTLAGLIRTHCPAWWGALTQEWNLEPELGRITEGLRPASIETDVLAHTQVVCVPLHGVAGHRDATTDAGTRRATR